MTKQFLLYALAIVAGSIVGEIAAVPLAIAIDILFGGNVTGSPWPLNAANVILLVIKGFMIGYVAGHIAGRRGKLMGAFAAFFLLTAMAVLSAAMNKDLISACCGSLETRPADWAWITLIPAMVGGHLAVKWGRQKISVVLGTLGMAILSIVSYIGAPLFHLWTITIAYRAGGFWAAVLSAAMPIFSEGYWFVVIWREVGSVVNQYAMRLLLMVVCAIFGAALIVVSRILGEREKRLSAFKAISEASKARAEADGAMLAAIVQRVAAEIGTAPIARDEKGEVFIHPRLQAEVNRPEYRGLMELLQMVASTWPIQ